MTTSRAQARHRSAAANPTINALSSSVTTGARRYRRRSAVIAASSGLLVTMGLPAAAVGTQAEETVESPAVAPAAPAAPLESTTAVIAVAPTAEVRPAVDESASVDSSEAERIEAEAAAAAARAEAERVAAEQAAAERAAQASATSTALASRDASVSRASRSADRTGAVVDAAPAAAAAAPAGSGVGASALAIARGYAGTPYVYGGSSPSGFDCSGLVQYAFRQAGVSLPRVAAAQASAGSRVSSSQARPGDLVSFTGSGGVYHIGIYAGNGQMVDAPRPGKPVALRSIWSSSVFFTRVG